MKLFSVILILNISTATCLAQKLSTARIDSIVFNLKARINEHFVSTDKAMRLTDSLTSSAFYNTTDRPEFIKALNEMLFYYTHDKHLAVEYNPDYSNELKSGRDDKTDQALKEKRENYGFEQAEILSGNIGYLKLNYFADVAHAKETAIRSIRALKKTKTLILDLRGNSGGSGSMVQLLCSIFLPKAEEPILNVFYKSGNTVTLKTQNIQPKYSNKPLYILTDSKTFSAAEAFTLVLKNRKRATIIGSTTAGAGNISGPYPLDKDYIITIPVGRIVDPLTKIGWEGIGVQPNIATEPDKSLEAAKALARKRVE